MSPAHWRKSGETLGPVYDSIVDRSSRFHVFPIEKVPLMFSLVLCTRTRPDFLTATMMTRGFSVWGVRA